jgi:hypothetical protein
MARKLNGLTDLKGVATELRALVLAPVVRFRFRGLSMQEADQVLVTELLFANGNLSITFLSAQRSFSGHLPQMTQSSGVVIFYSFLYGGPKAIAGSEQCTAFMNAF